MGQIIPLHPETKRALVEGYWMLSRANRLGDVEKPVDVEAVQFLKVACSHTGFPALRLRAAEMFASFYPEYLPQQPTPGAA